MHKKPHQSTSSAQHNGKKSRQPSHVRLIGGKWRGRKLPIVSAVGLRPTGDRIRETVFNWLAPHIQGAKVLDAFAGSGALGFEALSRGAGECVFIEKHVQASQNLEANLTLLKNSDVVDKSQQNNLATNRLINGSCTEYLTQTPKETFDIVFIDPPFAENFWGVTLELLSQGWLAQGAFLYLEMPTGMAIPDAKNWQILKQKKAGQVSYSLLTLLPKQDIDAQPR